MTWTQNMWWQQKHKRSHSFLFVPTFPPSARCWATADTFSSRERSLDWVAWEMKFTTSSGTSVTPSFLAEDERDQNQHEAEISQVSKCRLNQCMNWAFAPDWPEENSSTLTHSTLPLVNLKCWVFQTTFWNGCSQLSFYCQGRLRAVFYDKLVEPRVRTTCWNWFVL